MLERPDRIHRTSHREELTIRLRTTTLTAALTAGLLAASIAPATAQTLEPAADTSTGTTYYVNCAAKTGGDGLTAATAWKTLASVNGHGAFQPGDTVRFKAGTTCKGTLAPKGNGVAGFPIVFDRYGSGAKPTIAGGGTGMETAAVTLKNESYVTVQNLHVTNRGSAATTSIFRSGVLVLNDKGGMLAGVTLRSLTIDNVTSKLYYQTGHDARDWGGISVHTVNRGSGDGFSGLQILNNSISGVGRTGIVTSNREYPRGIDQVRIAGNTVSKSRGDGIIMRGAANSSIDHNLVKNNSNMWPCAQCMRVKGMGANAGIWPTWSRDSVIEKNNVYGTNVGHGDGEGIDLDIMAERIVVQYNYVHDNKGGGVLFCGSKSSVVRFNIFENNAKSAVAFIGSVPAKDSSFYNNTVYSARSLNAANVRYFNGAHGSGIRYFNNVVYNSGKGSWLFPAKVSASSNSVVGTRAAGEPAGTNHVDPKLKNPGSGTNSMSSLGGYKPKSPSKLQRGIAIPSTVTVDFFGKTVNPAKPPRGAAG